MKSTTLFTIALKLTGLIALWQFIQSLSGLITGVGLVSMLAGNLYGGNYFMALIGFSMLINVVIIGAFAFFCLFRTNILLKLFGMDDPEVIATEHNQITFLKSLVLAIAVLITISGISGFLSYNYNTETKTEQNINPQTNVFDTRTTTIHTETKKVNYLAIVEILAGVLLLSNITSVANRLAEKTAYKSYE